MEIHFKFGVVNLSLANPTTKTFVNLYIIAGVIKPFNSIFGENYIIPVPIVDFNLKSQLNTPTVAW